MEQSESLMVRVINSKSLPENLKVDMRLQRTILILFLKLTLFVQ